MSKKKFVLRIREDTMRDVEKWAADEFRSVNGQLEWMITRSLKEANRYRGTEDPSEEDNEEDQKES